MIKVDEEYEKKYGSYYTERLNFGKHKGRYIAEVAKNDPEYLHWVVNNWKGKRTKFYSIICGHLGMATRLANFTKKMNIQEYEKSKETL